MAHLVVLERVDCLADHGARHLAPSDSKCSVTKVSVKRWQCHPGPIYDLRCRWLWTVIDCHSLEIYTALLLYLLSFSVKRWQCRPLGWRHLVTAGEGLHRRWQRLGVDVKVNLTAPCIFCVENH